MGTEAEPRTVKNRNESHLHYEIKRAALLFLHERMGARLLGLEVRYRGPTFTEYVADVAGHADGAIVERTVGPRGGVRRRVVGRRDDLVVVEVKASRSDFLRDGAITAEITRRIARLAVLRESTEARLREAEPGLFRTPTLFREHGRWEYERAEDDEWLGLSRRMASLEERLHRGTKLESMPRDRAFHLHYVAAPAGVATPDELPPEWGLLVFEPPHRLAVAREAPRREIDDAARARLLREIARAGSRALLREAGIRGREEGLFIPEDEDEAAGHRGPDPR